jgi:hypothetical protein
VRLEGTLDAFSLPDIFSLLSMTKKTGGLHLRRPGAHGAVWLTDGQLTGGASELSRLSLGRRLAGSGQIAENHLSAAVDEVRRGEDVGIARALRDSRAIDEGELHTVVCEHIVDTVFDLMRWPDGEFEFIIDEANIDDVGVTRQVDDVVTEARQRLELWEAIEEKVANRETVLSMSLDLEADPQVQRDEWELLALVDGRRSVGDLVSLCGRGDYAVVIALAELVNRGLIRTDEPEGVTALLQRQALVASLEAASSVDVVTTPSRRRSTTKKTDSQDGQGADPTEDVDVDMADDDDEDDDRVTQIGSHSRLSGEVGPVTPERPEPFVPDREPDHPEPMAAAMAGGGLVAASAVPAGLIERDPSVNKSLLLRLIAGVRGL